MKTLNTNATIPKYKINVYNGFLHWKSFIFKPKFRFLLANHLTMPKVSHLLPNGATLSN